MADDNYYEEYGDECSHDEKPYTKWKVEDAYRSVCEARKALDDPKMRKFIAKYAKIKEKEAAKTQQEAKLLSKVGTKMKEVGL